MLYGSRRTLELMDKERVSGADNQDLVSELEDKITELKMERQRFFDQRREYNKLISSDGRREHLYEELSAAASRLPSLLDGYMVSSDSYPIIRDGEAEAVLVLGDWHYGMTCDNVFNTFNTDICRSRVARVIHEAKAKIEHNGCNSLHVVLLGDFFHGAIHTSARVASEELVCDQIMQVAEILARSIASLSESVPGEVKVYATYGNHGRTVANKKDNIHRDNMERLIPWWLRERLGGFEEIEIMPESDDEYLMINAAGHDICAAHGDLDSVKNSARLLTSLLNKKYHASIEYIILGDKHHRESFEELGVTTTICGSLCGTDDYANANRLFSTPSQLLLIVDPERGVDAEYRIKC